MESVARVVEAEVAAFRAMCEAEGLKVDLWVDPNPILPLYAARWRATTSDSCCDATIAGDVSPGAVRDEIRKILRMIASRRPRAEPRSPASPLAPASK